MSEIIWNKIENTKTDRDEKIKYFLIIRIVVTSLIGFAIWAILVYGILNNHALDWMLVFILFPGFFIGYLGGMYYIQRKF